MRPPDPVPIEELYDEPTLRRLGVDPAPTRAAVSMAHGLGLEYEFDSDPAVVLHHVGRVDQNERVDGGLLGDPHDPHGEYGEHGDHDPHGDQGRLAADEAPPAPRSTVRSQVGRPLSGLVLAAAMSGVGEVFEPESRRAAMVEFDPGHDHFSDRPVQFVMVPGCPRASRILLRPWLRAG